MSEKPYEALHLFNLTAILSSRLSANPEVEAGLSSKSMRVPVIKVMEHVWSITHIKAMLGTI